MRELEVLTEGIDLGGSWATHVDVDPESNRVILKSGAEGEDEGDLISFIPKGAISFAEALETLSGISEKAKSSGMILLIGGCLVMVRSEKARLLAQQIREAALMASPVGGKGMVS